MNSSENNFHIFYNDVEQPMPEQPASSQPSPEQPNQSGQSANIEQQATEPSLEGIKKLGSVAMASREAEKSNESFARKTFERAKKVAALGLMCTTVFLVACGAQRVSGQKEGRDAQDRVSVAQGGELDQDEDRDTQGESREQLNKVTYDYSHYADRNGKESYNAYDYDMSDRFGDRAATTEGIMEVAKATPEALSSYAYNLLTPEEKTEVGLDDKITMTGIDDRISNDPDGGVLQQKLLNKLEEILQSEDISYQFYYENDIEDTNYIYFADDSEDGVMAPAKMHLGYDTQKRNKAPQVDIYRKLRMADGKFYKVKMLDLNYLCGFQPNYEKGEVPNGVPRIHADSPEIPQPATEPPTTPANTEPSVPPETLKAKDSKRLTQEDLEIMDQVANEIRSGEIHVEQDQGVDNRDLNSQPTPHSETPNVQNNSSKDAEQPQTISNPQNNYGEERGKEHSGEYAPVEPDDNGQKQADGNETPNEELPGKGDPDSDAILRDLGIN